QHQRPVGRRLVLESRRELGEARERVGGGLVGGAVLELDRDWIAGGLAALELDVDELADRHVGIEPREAAAAQDRGFERQLRRDADARLARARRIAGLEIEDGVAVALPLDAVGAAVEAQAAGAERNRDLAADLGMHGDQPGAAVALPADEPARDALEA